MKTPQTKDKKCVELVTESGKTKTFSVTPNTTTSQLIEKLGLKKHFLFRKDGLVFWGNDFPFEEVSHYDRLLVTSWKKLLG